MASWRIVFLLSQNWSEQISEIRSVAEIIPQIFLIRYVIHFRVKVVWPIINYCVCQIFILLLEREYVMT